MIISWVWCPLHRVWLPLELSVFVPYSASWMHHLACWFTTLSVSCLFPTHLSVSANHDCTRVSNNQVQVSTLHACQWAVGGRWSLHGWLRGWLHTLKPLFIDFLGWWHVDRYCKAGMLIDAHGSAFIRRSFVSLKMFILINLTLVCGDFFFFWNDDNRSGFVHPMNSSISFLWCIEFHLLFALAQCCSIEYSASQRV